MGLAPSRLTAPTPPGFGVPSRSQDDSRMNQPAQSFQRVASARTAYTTSGGAEDVASVANENSATGGTYRSIAHASRVGFTHIDDCAGGRRRSALAGDSTTSLGR